MADSREKKGGAAVAAVAAVAAPAAPSPAPALFAAPAAPSPAPALFAAPGAPTFAAPGASTFAAPTFAVPVATAVATQVAPDFGDFTDAGGEAPGAETEVYYAAPPALAGYRATARGALLHAMWSYSTQIHNDTLPAADRKALELLRVEGWAARVEEGEELVAWEAVTDDWSESQTHCVALVGLLSQPYRPAIVAPAASPAAPPEPFSDSDDEPEPAAQPAAQQPAAQQPAAGPAAAQLANAQHVHNNNNNDDNFDDIAHETMVRMTIRDAVVRGLGATAGRTVARMLAMRLIERA